MENSGGPTIIGILIYLAAYYVVTTFRGDIKRLKETREKARLERQDQEKKAPEEQQQRERRELLEKRVKASPQSKELPQPEEQQQWEIPKKRVEASSQPEEQRQREMLEKRVEASPQAEDLHRSEKTTKITKEAQPDSPAAGPRYLRRLRWGRYLVVDANRQPIAEYACVHCARRHATSGQQQPPCSCPPQSVAIYSQDSQALNRFNDALNSMDDDRNKGNV